MRSQTLHRVRALSALVAATVVAACGGGSDAPPPPVASPPPTPATATISGKALYGRLLQGASACYDTNANRACDTGEPATTAASDANGAFTLDVPNAQVGQRRIVVNVPATAVDTELGQAVGTAFTMLAPATGTSAWPSLARGIPRKLQETWVRRWPPPHRFVRRGTGWHVGRSAQAPACGLPGVERTRANA